MIVKIKVIRDGRAMERTFSDRGVWIRGLSDGRLYKEAYDLPGAGQGYEETSASPSK